jgi:hypothetical protein
LTGFDRGFDAVSVGTAARVEPFVVVDELATFWAKAIWGHRDPTAKRKTSLRTKHSMSHTRPTFGLIVNGSCATYSLVMA